MKIKATIIFLFFYFPFCLQAQNPFTEFIGEDYLGEGITLEEFSSICLDPENKKYLNLEYCVQGLYPIHTFMGMFSSFWVEYEFINEAPDSDEVEALYSCIEYLITNGPDLNFKPEKLYVPTPLMFSMNMNYLRGLPLNAEEMARLTDYGADYYLKSPDLNAYVNYFNIALDENIIARIQTKEIAESQLQISLLEIMIAKGESSTLAELNKKGLAYDIARSDWYGLSPMGFALLQNGVEEFEYQRITTPFFDMEDGYDKSFITMQQLGGDINHRIYEDHYSLFEMANDDMAAYMIENGLEINQKCPVCSHETLLHRMSTTFGSIDKAQMLVESGAEVDAKDDDGKTPLMWALNTRNIAVAKYLIDEGADIDAVDNKGKTVQKYAKKLIKQDEELAKRLGL